MTNSDAKELMIAAVKVGRYLDLADHDVCRRLMELRTVGVRLHTVAIQQCNGPWDEEKDGGRQTRLETEAREIAAGLKLDVEFLRDPRYWTIKIKSKDQPEGEEFEIVLV